MATNPFLVSPLYADDLPELHRLLRAEGTTKRDRLFERTSSTPTYRGTIAILMCRATSKILAKYVLNRGSSGMHFPGIAGIPAFRGRKEVSPGLAGDILFCSPEMHFPGIAEYGHRFLGNAFPGYVPWDSEPRASASGPVAREMLHRVRTARVSKRTICTENPG